MTTAPRPSDQSPLARPEPKTLDGIDARLRGYVDSLPRSRFTTSGESIWEFRLRLVDTYLLFQERVIVRLADERYGQIQSWVKLGRHVYCRGVLHLMRWSDMTPGRAGYRKHALLMLELINIMPLDQPAPPSKSELDLKPPARNLRQDEALASVPADDVTKARAARVRELLDGN